MHSPRFAGEGSLGATLHPFIASCHAQSFCSDVAKASPAKRWRVREGALRLKFQRDHHLRQRALARYARSRCDKPIRGTE